MKAFRFVLSSLLFAIVFYASAQAQIPNLEAIRALPNSTSGVVTTASDGYGQHLVTENSGQIRHVLIDNNGNELTAYSSIIVPSGGGFPVVTSYGGQLRVTMKQATSDIKVYQSTDGGATWPTVFNYLAPAAVYDIDAFSDGYGTHITWATGTSLPSTYEVHYVRYNNATNTFQDYKNVSELQSVINQGGRPKVTTSSNQAHVEFIAPNDARLWSRDLDLQSHVWENSFAITAVIGVEGAIVSTNATTIGDSIYAIAAAKVAGGSQNPIHMTQDFYLLRRHKDEASWRDPFLVTTTTLGLGESSMRNRLVTAGGSFYFLVNCNYWSAFPSACFQPRIDIISYSPQTLFAGYNLWTGSPGSLLTTEGASLLMSSWLGGAYAFWYGQPNPANTNMCRKPLAITGTISERTLLTGNNWVSGQSAKIAHNIVTDAMSNSVTTVFDNSWLTVNGTLNAQQASQFKFGSASGLVSYGQLNAYGTQSLPVSFASVYGGGGTWSGITLNGSGANGSTLQYATVANVLTYWSSAVNILSVSNVNINNCNISGNMNYGTTGLYLNNANDALIGYNIISGNGGNGIRFDETGWANVFKNTIENNANAGVYSVHSSMAFGTQPFYSPDGNNSIIGGTYGVEAFWYSYPWMGSVDNTWVGYNSVCNNTSYRVRASDNSIVAADWTWWGTSNPSSSLFLEENGWKDYMGEFS